MVYGQIYECSDEASDDWYWLYAAVAFDDIPMTVISNDRTRYKAGAAISTSLLLSLAAVLLRSLRC